MPENDEDPAVALMLAAVQRWESSGKPAQEIYRYDCPRCAAPSTAWIRITRAVASDRPLLRGGCPACHWSAMS